MVVCSAGLEPATYWLRVNCPTSWATNTYELKKSNKPVVSLLDGIYSYLTIYERHDEWYPDSILLKLCFLIKYSISNILKLVMSIFSFQWIFFYGGEGGIRTLASETRPNSLAGSPLTHLSTPPYYDAGEGHYSLHLLHVLPERLRPSSLFQTWWFVRQHLVGGESGIRTHDTRKGATVFKTVPLWPLRYLTIR